MHQMFIVIVSSLMMFYGGFSWAKEEFYLKNYELVDLPRLSPSAMEQILEFKTVRTTYNFRLVPKYALITNETSINVVTKDKDSNKIERKIYPAPFQAQSFEGLSSPKEPLRSIRGSVNVDGEFEGFLMDGDDVYLLEPSHRYELEANRSLKEVIHAGNSILAKISEVCSKIRQMTDERKEEQQPKCPTSSDWQPCNGKERVLSRRRNADLTRPEFQPTKGEMAQIAGSQPIELNRTYLCNLIIHCDYYFYKEVGKLSANTTSRVVLSLLSKVDSKFRKMDFNDDGYPDNIGFYIDSLSIHTTPPDKSNSDWNPVSFFREFQQYNFSGACAGLLFTHRDMQTSDKTVPSIIRTQLVSEQQGICSELNVTLPKMVQYDYGEYIANALPVNFKLRECVAREPVMIVQVLHQLGHLFGAPNDDFYNSKDVCCTNMKGRIFAMTFPMPIGDSEEHFTYSQCSIQAIANYLKSSSRPCLRACEGIDCTKPLLGTQPATKMLTSHANFTNFTQLPTGTRDWTEYCFTVPRSNAQHLHHNFLWPRLLAVIFSAIVASI